MCVAFVHTAEEVVGAEVKLETGVPHAALNFILNILFISPVILSKFPCSEVISCPKN
jgi:hypothetical protein